MNSTFWDERYGAEAFAYGTEPNDFLRANAGRLPKGRVLCLAEGEGRNAAFLAGLGYTVTAVDFSAEGVKKTQRLAREKGVTVTAVHADLATWTAPDASFEGVVAIFAHLPPPVRRLVHGWVARALTPGGVFLLEAYSPAQLALNTGGPRDAAFLMTPASLREELQGLTIESAVEIEREVREGAFHTGRAATVQAIARRPA
jgi:SAM-dependent methyltransferase